MTPLVWRVLRDAPLLGAWNMAMDHALAETLVDGEAALRLYRWVHPTVSFGRNEPARGLYSVEAASERGIEYVRRPTGGRAVLHDDEVTYAVIAPARAMGGARTAYRRINEALAVALRGLGAPVTLTQSAVALRPDAGPCFQAPADGEVTAQGRKLVGSAQARVGRTLLQHGSIILSGDQSTLDLLSKKDAATQDAPATLTALVDGVDFDMVADAVQDAMGNTFAGQWSNEGYRLQEIDLAEKLRTGRYDRDEWTWRR